jgi:hypothetical protein
MASKNKLAKTDKRKHWGIGGNFLKYTGKMKRIAFYNSAKRKQLKNNLLWQKE